MSEATPQGECHHPEERRFAWTVFDVREERYLLCMGCCVCGAVLSGGVDAHGEPVGPQYYLGPKPKKSRKKSQ